MQYSALPPHLLGGGGGGGLPGLQRAHTTNQPVVRAGTSHKRPSWDMSASNRICEEKEGEGIEADERFELERGLRDESKEDNEGSALPNGLCKVCGDDVEVPGHNVCFWHALTLKSDDGYALHESEAVHSLNHYSGNVDAYLGRVDQKRQDTIGSMLGTMRRPRRDVVGGSVPRARETQRRD